ncbi:zinc-binding alcohol dehydrogenase family protein [Microbulbifer taiwanensis]|uniref:zinc-binding alcohol dehydrogenase family protein n=1 Tax=Microbulbifer taiwanensis TaxID=986746 RepID=UPI00360F0CE0
MGPAGKRAGCFRQSRRHQGAPGCSGGADGFRVLGWDACGIVHSTGPEVDGFRPGDRVWYAGDYGRAGSNAEQQLVDARLVSRSPASLTPAQAAALPLTSLTAWEALFERLGYSAEPSEWNRANPLLIINGAGGVGSIALQLCRLAGIPVTATASRAQSRDWCRQMGATDVIDHAELAQWPEASFARILCCHDTDRYFDTMARLVAPQGLICALSSTKEPHQLQPLMSKSAGFVWEFMFTRSQYHTADMGRQGQILEAVARLVDEGQLQSTLTETVTGLSADNIRNMHRRQEEGGLIGKQVLLLDGRER